jgi:endonuclease-3
MVTPRLFTQYPTPAHFVAAPTFELESVIRSTGFFRNKAKNIQGACKMIVNEFGGQVPSSMAQLLRLPGVARKTANVVLGNGFGIVEGVVVDTHIGRISRRLGFTQSEDPVIVERDLMELLPKPAWLEFCHQAIWHGRAVCAAQKPRCDACVLASLCPAAPRG